MATGCTGAGPECSPTARWCTPSRRTEPAPAHIARMTPIASSSASTAAPGASRTPPAASMASQNAPVPIPSSTRPPLRMSSEATDPASTTGLRSGRFATFGATRRVEVRAATTDRRVQASR